MRRESLMLFALLASMPALEASAAVFVEQPDRWGRLVRIVRPEYPPEALRTRQAGSVEIEGVVEGSGRIGHVTYKPNAPAAEAFVAALRGVVPFWQFAPNPGPDCQPDGRTVSARVDFEIDAGQPRIFVTQPAGRGAGGPAALAPLRTARPSYPRAMRMRAVEGRAYARADVDASGAVVAVSAKAYPRRPPVAVSLASAGSLVPGTLSPQREEELAEFAHEAEQSMKRWVFPATADRAAATRVFCVEFLFNLDD